MPFRRFSAALVALLAVFALSACEKPTPGISVFSGTTSENSQAVCWSFDSDNLEPGACAEDLIANADAATIPVLPGDTVGISVDPAVADSGWTASIGTTRLNAQPLSGHYFRFTFPDLQEIPAEGFPLVISAGRDTKTRGVWVFRLVPST